VRGKAWEARKAGPLPTGDDYRELAGKIREIACMTPASGAITSTGEPITGSRAPTFAPGDRNPISGS
jgi:hypothetical protein